MNKLVNLKDNDDILIPKVLGGIDSNNVLLFADSLTNYTITEDCWLSTSRNVAHTITINGNKITSDLGVSDVIIPLLKGQVVSVSNTYLWLYGVAYH